MIFVLKNAQQTQNIQFLGLMLIWYDDEMPQLGFDSVYTWGNVLKTSPGGFSGKIVYWCWTILKTGW